ncbi:nucleotidyltransferase family protein [Pelotomaculum propionicicum]|uniref:nucleotidyltransferase family protein n=1 Tax=Pelotomaculum propionicicum TaxID=258475 RepID=UPI003B808BA4
MGSDIDILVEYAQDAKPTLFKMVYMKHELEDCLQTKVDVVTEKSVSPHMRPYIMKDLRVLCKPTGFSSG